jgi:hypothetical protein
VIQAKLGDEQKIRSLKVAKLVRRACTVHYAASGAASALDVLHAAKADEEDATEIATAGGLLATRK